MGGFYKSMASSSGFVNQECGIEYVSKKYFGKYLSVGKILRQPSSCNKAAEKRERKTWNFAVMEEQAINFLLANPESSIKDFCESIGISQKYFGKHFSIKGIYKKAEERDGKHRGRKYWDFNVMEEEVMTFLLSNTENNIKGFCESIGISRNYFGSRFYIREIYKKVDCLSNSRSLKISEEAAKTLEQNHKQNFEVMKRKLDNQTIPLALQPSGAEDPAGSYTKNYAVKAVTTTVDKSGRYSNPSLVGSVNLAQSKSEGIAAVTTAVKLFRKSDWQYRLAELMYKLLEERDAILSKPNLQIWANSFDYIGGLGRGQNEIERVLNFSQQDEFWSCIVLAPENLAKHFMRLKQFMLKKENSLKKALYTYSQVCYMVQKDGRQWRDFILCHPVEVGVTTAAVTTAVDKSVRCSNPSPVGSVNLGQSKSEGIAAVTTAYWDTKCGICPYPKAKKDIEVLLRKRGDYNAGVYQWNIGKDGTKLPAGFYFYQLLSSKEDYEDSGLNLKFYKDDYEIVDGE